MSMRESVSTMGESMSMVRRRVDCEKKRVDGMRYDGE